jgi:hypothetical protein
MQRRNNNWCLCSVVWFRMRNIAKKGRHGCFSMTKWCFLRKHADRKMLRIEIKIPISKLLTQLTVWFCICALYFT